jgi:hypothetical protein
LAVFDRFTSPKKTKSVDECVAALQAAVRESTTTREPFERVLGEKAICSCGVEFRLSDRLSQPAGWWFRFVCPACSKETGVRHDD